MALKLPVELREKLKKPYGKLYRCKGEDCLKQVIEELPDPVRIISIGDVTTYYLLKANVIPDMCLVDDMTMRIPVDRAMKQGTAHRSFKEVTVINPPGVVTGELMDAIKDNMDSRIPVRIFVDGEEDLAVIPACIYAPIGSVVIYGQPGEGMVVVEITEEKKQQTLSLIEQMIEENAS
ncbi:DUF359 domain-containing protein [Methanocella sp. CWC-04]|uniref:GTP-dependent dephospho-CoA kinase n=1 Tax=Methanooceanicella nereidis TaxID=2052831 RepID=A0AAP2RC44_9EURY|nr:GTP-dependent dephospho-CoA kinase family protein [Methanocella sp. CWC-04]MCD1294799.1 DUF359 domain-containing protein [Methanocella sp. CWC-04]